MNDQGRYLGIGELSLNTWRTDSFRRTLCYGLVRRTHTRCITRCCSVRGPATGPATAPSPCPTAPANRVALLFQVVDPRHR